MKKVRLAFTHGGVRAAVELLAEGQQVVVEGPHPAGGSYFWIGAHPCDADPDNLPSIHEEKAALFYQELEALLRAEGAALEERHTVGASGARHSLEAPGARAPRPELVDELLERFDVNSVESHDELVAVLAAVQASYGPDRHERRGRVIDWALGYGGNTADYVEKTLDSIHDTALGWPWLASRAGAGDVAAQADFDDSDPGDTDAPDPIETARAAMVDRFVYCIGLDRYVDLPTGDMLTDKAFNALNVAVARFGKTGVDSAAATFQNHAAARKVPIATYRPGQPAIVQEEANGSMRDAVNLYRPALLKPIDATAADVRPWLGHLELLFGAGSPALAHFLDYLAFILQNPGVKVNHALVLLGEEGIGKDTALEPFRRAIGAHNANAIGPERLQDQFNDDWIQRQFVVLNEAHTFHRRETMNLLKPLLAAPPDTLQVNRKGVPRYSVPNIINVVMFTNHEDALAPSRGDRRYWMHKCLIDEKPDQHSHFIPLWAWINAGGDARVFGFLAARDVSGFNPKEPPPMTEAKSDMIEASSPPAARWLEEQFEEGGSFHSRSILTVREVVSAAQSGFEVPSRVADSIRESLVVHELKRHGFRAVEGKVKVDGKTTRVWAKGKPPAEHHLVLHRLEAERTASLRTQ